MVFIASVVGVATMGRVTSGNPRTQIMCRLHSYFRVVNPYNSLITSCIYLRYNCKLLRWEAILSSSCLVIPPCAKQRHCARHHADHASHHLWSEHASRPSPSLRWPVNELSVRHRRWHPTNSTCSNPCVMCSDSSSV